jgi:hypothetical protein
VSVYGVSGTVQAFVGVGIFVSVSFFFSWRIGLVVLGV